MASITLIALLSTECVTSIYVVRFNYHVFPIFLNLVYGFSGIEVRFIVIIKDLVCPCKSMFYLFSLHLLCKFIFLLLLLHLAITLKWYVYCHKRLKFYDVNCKCSIIKNSKQSVIAPDRTHTRCLQQHFIRNKLVEIIHPISYRF